MYFTKTPYIIKKLLPSILWKSRVSRTIHLTFDDGPTPEVTEYVLDTLHRHGAKASFFCLGSQAQAHPEIIDRIRKEGHRIGHHTYDHLDGWKTDVDTYLDNVDKAEDILKSKLFRPPFGRITPEQYRRLKKKYKIIMWDVMAGDFDQSRSPDTCYEKIIDNIEDGSIVVLHDNEKSFATLQIVLPRLLDHLTENEWKLLPL